LLLPIIVENAMMGTKARKSETVKVSRLGCMRKSTVETDMAGKTVEHVEVWVDDDSGAKHGSQLREESPSTESESEQPKRAPEIEGRSFDES
jgi:hypothetical protein